jgi:DNA-directed RNA polymerase specialized sigma24 family protein
MPDDAARLVEETQLMMASLSPLHRRILQLCLQVHDVDEAAEQAGCSERTVERAMKMSRTRLEQRLFRDAGP